MKPKYIAVFVTLLGLLLLFVGFQNFSFQKKKLNSAELSSLIEESELDRRQLHEQVQEQAPPDEISMDGLVGAGEKMKRVRIEGSSENVHVKESGMRVPSSSKRTSDTSDKSLERLAQEFQE